MSFKNVTPALINAGFKDFGDYIDQALIDWKTPGVAVAVLKGDQVLHCQGHGLRDVEQGLPVTLNTRFPIASMTKAFTAMGAALLVERGKLDWDQPIRDVLPEFRLMDDYATKYANLRDLLSHRTGLPRHDSTWYGQSKTDVELVKGLRHLKPNASFREMWQYNNLMYETVGHLCAQVSGAESWTQFIQTEVIDALGLKETTANFDPACTRFEDVAEPYALKHGAEAATKTPRYIHTTGMAAGSIQSTLSDLIQWHQLHLKGGVNRGEAFVSPYNLSQMHKPHMLIPPTVLQAKMFRNELFAYGMGWFIEPYQGRTLIHHGGNLDGFSVMGAFMPQEDIVVIVLTNINQKSLRAALMYEAVDRALGIESRDWSGQILKRDKENVQAEVKGLASAAADRQPQYLPSHELQDYIGHYSAPGYSDIEVREEQGELQALYYGEWWPLEHYNRNVFELNKVRFDTRMKLTFDLDLYGNISQLQLPVEPAIGPMIFTRQPGALPEKHQQTLVGQYDYPVEAHAVEVTLKDHQLFLTLTGQKPKQLDFVAAVEEGTDDGASHSVKASSNSRRLVFKFKGNAESLVEFSDQGKDKGFNHIVLKHPGLTYECRRLDGNSTQ